MLDFIFASWLLWPLALLAFGLFAALAENNHGVLAGFIIGGLLTGFQLFSSYQPLSFIVNDPLKAIWITGAYFLVGFVYMYVKWAFVAHRASNDKALWNGKDVGNRYYYNGSSKSIPFKVSEWKSELLTWFSLWPFSAAWTLLNDPIRIIFDTVYAWSSKRLQSISDSFFK